MQYRYCCVSPKSLRELNFICDNSREITAGTFKRAIGIDNYNQLSLDLGYDKQLKRDTGLSLESDFAVSFHKSKLPDNRKVYYCCHSAIEYIYY